MLNGIDVSRWNIAKDVETHSIGKDFLIAKATEGKTWKDKCFERNLDIARKNGIELLGAYHYAKTLNNPLEDAHNYLKSVCKVKELGKTLLLALDLESDDMNRKNAIEWALIWLKEVENHTGIKPLIYTNAYNTNKLLPILNNNNGLWVAHYNVSNPKIGVYPFCAMWQYTCKPIDRNTFYGNKEQYLKYCRKGVKK